MYKRQVVYYYLVPQQKGAEVTFQLREGVNASENSGFLDAGTNIVIYTSNLEPAPEMVSKFTKGESNLGSGTYWYYTSVDGPDNLKFVTTKANSAEVIRFASATKESSGDYKSCSVELANYGEWMLSLIHIYTDQIYGSLLEYPGQISDDGMAELVPNDKCIAFNVFVPFATDAKSNADGVTGNKIENPTIQFQFDNEVTGYALQ